MTKTNDNILGLDLGTSSIGWALIRENNGHPAGMIACGVRIFQETTEAKTGVPKNQTRRASRGARRVLARRKIRRDNVMNLLTQNGLLPKDEKERLAVLTDSIKYDPYKLRKQALDEGLAPFELGRVFYHLSKRRGFLSNRKAQKKDDDSKAKNEITTLRRKIEGSNCRTLGEYLAGEAEKRGLHTDRKMYQDEFESIWQAQQKHHPEILIQPLKVAIHKAIFHQRPLNLQKNLIGKCTFEPHKKRASRALLEYQRFRTLQDINHLEVKDPLTRGYRALREDERGKLYALLEKQKTMGWGSARKALGLHEGEIFNLEEGKKKGLDGNQTAYAMREILGKEWDDMAEEKQGLLITDMLTIDNEQGFLNRMMSHWGFDDDTAETLAKTELAPGYARLSVKAIRKILPHLEKGLIYSDACKEAGYNHSDTSSFGSAVVLAEPPYLRNPIVQKALFETRRVVNAIIRQHGRPSCIRIEMARDMKLTKRQKDDLSKTQRTREKENDKARAILQKEFNIQNPSRDDIQKYHMWEECKETCPYTGKTISREMLYGPEVDVEHILPYSRTLDDSYMNKTLCMADENRAVKHNKTPYEAYSADREKYEQMLQRIKNLPWPKRRRFEQKEIDTDKFVERQLNDTRYICREVRKYLQQIGVNAEVTKGEATAAIRHRWNLNRILTPDGSGEKNRSDHRHHAIDAIVIALTSRGLFQMLSRLSAESGVALSQRGFNLPPPWQSFYSDACRGIEGIVVSHASSRKISGALHEESAYGHVVIEEKERIPLSAITKDMIEHIGDEKIKELVMQRLKDSGGNLKKAFRDPSNPLLHADNKTPVNSVRLHAERFAKRTPLSSVKTKNMIENIGDEKVKELVEKRLEDCGGDFKKAFGDPSKPLLHVDDKTPIKSVRLHETVRHPEMSMHAVKRDGIPYKFFELGSNHHVEIIEDIKTKERKGDFVTTIEAARRARIKKTPIVCRDHGPDFKFIMSLCANDMLEIVDDNGVVEHYRVQQMSGPNNTIVLRQHSVKAKDNRDRSGVLQCTPNTLPLKSRKVAIDSIGNIYPCND